MSFSFEAKNELCRLPVQKLCCARAEAYGILLYCNTFSAGEVRIITGNPALAARLPKLFHRAFNARFDRTPEAGETGKLVFQITDGAKLRRIVDLLGFSPEQNLALHINFGLLEEECCRAAFLRGVFFAGGSVTDPAKRYHLELATSHLQVSRELEVLLRECGYPPKSVSRNGSYHHLLQAERPDRGLSHPHRRAGGGHERHDRQAGEGPAQQRQPPPQLRQRQPGQGGGGRPGAAGGHPPPPGGGPSGPAAGEAPADGGGSGWTYPELTLSELAEAFDPPVTKSCLNHRLRKIQQLAKGL